MWFLLSLSWWRTWLAILEKHLIIEKKVAIFFINSHIKTNLFSIWSLINNNISLLCLLIVNAFNVFTLEMLRSDILVDEFEEIWLGWFCWNWCFLGLGSHTYLLLSLYNLFSLLNLHNFEFVCLAIHHCHESFWFPIEEILSLGQANFLSNSKRVCFDWNLFDEEIKDRINEGVIVKILLTPLNFEADWTLRSVLW